MPAPYEVPLHNTFGYIYFQKVQKKIDFSKLSK